MKIFVLLWVVVLLTSLTVYLWPKKDWKLVGENKEISMRYYTHKDKGFMAVATRRPEPSGNGFCILASGHSARPLSSDELREMNKDIERHLDF